MEKIPVPVVTVLDLKIGSRGHVFGPLLLYLLGIYPAVQKLDIILLEPQVFFFQTSFFFLFYSSVLTVFQCK